MPLLLKKKAGDIRVFSVTFAIFHELLHWRMSSITNNFSDVVGGAPGLTRDRVLTNKGSLLLNLSAEAGNENIEDPSKVATI